MKALLITLGSIAVIAGIVAMMYVTASNGEIKIKNELIAQKEVCESYFDKMWKIIQQKAQVSDEYKESFKEIYPALMEGRYATGGSFMKWITEDNPDFKVELYQDLMKSIEAERTGFFMEQKKLADMQNQHRTFRETFPNSLFIGGRPDVPYVIITSEKTKAAYSTGEDNDIDLFKKQDGEGEK